MSAEFDTVAEWTARVAMELGTSFRIPAACRGSGSPSALDWLLDRMELKPGRSLLDCGAGVGGPAEYAARLRSVRPVLVDPEAGACRAARTLFANPVVQASADRLPLVSESFDTAWSLGVLCTLRDQSALLRELRRVVRPSGCMGLLVFVARTAQPLDASTGNYFPTEDKLLDLIEGADLAVDMRRGTEGLPPTPSDWQHRVRAVTDELQRRHGGTRAWQLAERQGNVIGELLANHTVTGELLILRRQGAPLAG